MTQEVSRPTGRRKNLGGSATGASGGRSQSQPREPHLDCVVAVGQDPSVDARRRREHADLSCEKVMRDLAVTRSDAPNGVIVETKRAGVRSERYDIPRGPGVGV